MNEGLQLELDHLLREANAARAAMEAAKDVHTLAKASARLRKAEARAREVLDMIQPIRRTAT